MEVRHAHTCHCAEACYLAGMKANQRNNASVTAPILKDLAEREKAQSKSIDPDPSVGSKPLDPPDLYQDPGGGYNQGFTFPQE